MLLYNALDVLIRKSYAVILSISGSAVTQGTPFVFFTANPTPPQPSARGISAATLSASTVIVVIGGDGIGGNVIVLSAPATTVTAPTGAASFGLTVDQCSICVLDATRALIAFRLNGVGTNIAMSISGTTITLGSSATFESGIVTINSIDNNFVPQGIVAIDSSTAMVCFGVSSLNYGLIISVSGITITNYSKVLIDNNNSIYHSPCLLDSDRIFLAYQETSPVNGIGIILRK
jgi:hypothetical protein